MSLLLLMLPALTAALLDIAVSPSLRLLGAHPSVSVAVLSVWSVLRRREEAMVVAPLTGLLLGLLGNEPLGASVLGLAPVVLLSAMRNPEITEGRFLATLAIAFAGTLAFTGIVAVAVAAAGRFVPSPVELGRDMAGAAVLTTPLAAVLYLPMIRVAWQPHVRGEFRRY